MLTDHREIAPIKEPGPKELAVLRTVYENLAQPVYDAMKKSDLHPVQVHIADRVLLGIATLVEASRDALVSAPLNGIDPETVTSLADLLNYAPEAVVMDQRMIALSRAKLKGDKPSDIMKSLGWSIRSDNALDGEIRRGFTGQELYELGKIHQLDNRK